MSNEPNLPSWENPPPDGSDLLPLPDGGHDRPSYGVTICELDSDTRLPLYHSVTCRWFTLMPSAEPPQHVPSTPIEEIRNACSLETLGGCLPGSASSCKIEHIELIPTIMRNNQWLVGARLMDRWFAGAATPNIAPQLGEADPRNLNPDFDSVTMEWLLTSPLPRGVYAQALREEVWVNDAARKEIGKYLKRNGKFQTKRMYFDDFGKPPDKRHESCIQNRPVKLTTLGNAYDYAKGIYKIDDYAVSCGDATFYFIVSGHVDPPEKGSTEHTVTITKVGTYLRDSYDFWDDDNNIFSQTLLYWKYPDYVGIDALGCYVSNKKFRDWREKHGTGGDFFIYSDLRVSRPQGLRNIFKIDQNSI